MKVTLTDLARPLRITSVLVAFTAAAALAGNGKVIRFPDRVPGLYIVMLEKSIPRKNTRAVAEILVNQHGGALRYVMNNTVSMFSIEMTETQATALARNQHVVQVEEVAEVHLSEVQQLPPPQPLNWMRLWNLDRIDQWATGDLNNYQFCERASNVIAYIPDTGVMGTHQEFRHPTQAGVSRVRPGACFAEDGSCGPNGGSVACPIVNDLGRDLTTSHGTAVASILGGLTVGVAKHVNIVPIRVFACDPANTPNNRWRNTEHLNWGLDWIRSANNPDRNHRPALVSMSTFVRTNDPLIASFEHVINGLVLDERDASGNVVWSGIPVIVSANNQDRTEHDLNGLQTSPARMAYRNDPSVATPGFASPGRVISVGGSGRRMIDAVLRDARWDCPMFAGEACWPEDSDGMAPWNDIPAYGSNFGNTVDIYAPAHDVESAYSSGIDRYRRPLDGVPYEARSGTSFAAPLVAGIAARILQVEQTLTPQQVWDRIRQNAQTVAVPFDTAGRDQNNNQTNNSLLAIRRYTSETCATEFP